MTSRPSLPQSLRHPVAHPKQALPGRGARQPVLLARKAEAEDERDDDGALLLQGGTAARGVHGQNAGHGQGSAGAATRKAATIPGGEASSAPGTQGHTDTGTTGENPAFHPADASAPTGANTAAGTSASSGMAAGNALTLGSLALFSVAASAATINHGSGTPAPHAPQATHPVATEAPTAVAAGTEAHHSPASGASTPENPASTTLTGNTPTDGSAHGNGGANPIASANPNTDAPASPDTGADASTPNGTSVADGGQPTPPAAQPTPPAGEGTGNGANPDATDASANTPSTPADQPPANTGSSSPAPAYPQDRTQELRVEADSGSVQLHRSILAGSDPARAPAWIRVTAIQENDDTDPQQSALFYLRDGERVAVNAGDTVAASHFGNLRWDTDQTNGGNFRFDAYGADDRQIDASTGQGVVVTEGEASRLLYQIDPRYFPALMDAYYPDSETPASYRIAVLDETDDSNGVSDALILGNGERHLVIGDLIRAEDTQQVYWDFASNRGGELGLIPLRADGSVIGHYPMGLEIESNRKTGATYHSEKSLGLDEPAPVLPLI